MKLRVLAPTHVEVDEDVDKVIAEAADGAFCLLPRHVDFVAALNPGILAYYWRGRERLLAVNGGTLVKCGDDVLVSTMAAVAGDDLGALRRAVEDVFENVGDRERRAYSALVKMEADFIRRFIEFEHA